MHHDWNQTIGTGCISVTRKRNEILQKAFQRVSAISLEEEKSYTSTGITLNRLDYGPILYRAYESCRSRPDEPLTEEEAYHLFEWVILSPARRGLERFSVGGLLDAIQEERTDTIQVVLYMQKMARRTHHIPHGHNHHGVHATLSSLSSSSSSLWSDESHDTTIAAVYATMCESSQKFALLLGRIDEAAVVYERNRTDAFTRLVEEAATASRVNRTALMQQASMKLFGNEQVLTIPSHAATADEGEHLATTAAFTSVESLLTCFCPATLSNTT
jgi:hypothetical protein